MQLILVDLKLNVEMVNGQVHLARGTVVAIVVRTLAIGCVRRSDFHLIDTHERLVNIDERRIEYVGLLARSIFDA